MARQQWSWRGVWVFAGFIATAPMFAIGGQGAIGSSRNQDTNAFNSAADDTYELQNRLTKAASTTRGAIAHQRATTDGLRAASFDPRLGTNFSGTKPLKNRIVEDDTRVGLSAWRTGFDGIEVTSKPPGGSLRSGLALQDTSKRISLSDDSKSGSRIGDIFTKPLGR